MRVYCTVESVLHCSVVVLAELLRGRRPREWSPIVILKGVLVIFYGHGKRNGSRARAPYIHTYIRTYVRTIS